MNPDLGMTESDARKSYSKLGEWDKELIAAMVDRLRLFGIPEGKAMAVLAAIGAKMIHAPDEPLWEVVR